MSSTFLLATYALGWVIALRIMANGLYYNDGPQGAPMTAAACGAIAATAWPLVAVLSAIGAVVRFAIKHAPHPRGNVAAYLIGDEPLMKRNAVKGIVPPKEQQRLSQKKQADREARARRGDWV